MMRTETVDAISGVANRVGYTGAGFTFFSYLTSNEFLGIFSAFVAVGGFTINWYYKREENKRKNLAEIREARAAALADEEKQLRVQMLRDRIRRAEQAKHECPDCNKQHYPYRQKDDEDSLFQDL